MIFDEKDKPVDFRFLEINSAFENQTGLYHAKGKRMKELVPDIDESTFETYGNVAKSGLSKRFVIEIRAMGRWFDAYAFRMGEPTSLTVGVLFTDITERKRNENELRESEEQYRNLFTSMYEAFCIIRMIYDEKNEPIDYLFLEVNPAFEKHTGMHEVVGKTAKEYFPDLENSWSQVFGKVAKTGVPTSFTTESKDLGSWLEVQASRLGGPNQGDLAVIFSNITNRKQAELEVVNQREQLYELFRQAPGAVIILSGPTYVVDLANPTALIIWGRRAEEVMHKPFFESMPDFRGQGLEQLLEGVYKTGNSYVGQELKIQIDQKGDGKPKDHYFTFVYTAKRNNQNEIEGIMIYAYDVTEQVLARQSIQDFMIQIEHQAKTFDIALSTVADFIYTFDLSGRFTYANKSLLKILGITLDEIMGKNFHDLHYPVDLATKLQAQIDEVIMSGKPLTDETHIDDLKRKASYYEYIFTPTYNTEGHIVAIGGSTRDITIRKQMEQQRDNFLAIASHELKTPITSIKAYTQILESRFTKANDASSIQLVSKMDAQLDKLISLVSDLLDVTKMEGGMIKYRKADFDINELISETVEQIARTTQGHNIKTELSSTKIVNGDSERIEQVLVNLLTNAIKYSPESKDIFIKTTVVDHELCVSVQDFGLGLSKPELGRIFERYYRADNTDQNTYPGLGLGLYISSEIIKRHNGKINAYSERGVGSTFFFTLPLISDSNEVEPINLQNEHGK